MHLSTERYELLADRLRHGLQYADESREAMLAALALLEQPDEKEEDDGGDAHDHAA
jgi:hypothetical protein